MITALSAAHEQGQSTSGVDIDNEKPEPADATKAGVYDLLLAKYWGIKFAVNAAATILRVDQVREGQSDTCAVRCLGTRINNKQTILGITRYLDCQGFENQRKYDLLI